MPVKQPDDESKIRRFVGPSELEIPEELDGWEQMYPEYFQFALTEDRIEYERSKFWFWDKKDTDEPLRPFDVSISGGMWQVAMSHTPSRLFGVPSAMTVDFRFVAGYCYVAPISVEDEELKAEREAVFEPRKEYIIENYDGLFNASWKPHVKEIGDQIKALEVPTELPQYVPEQVVIESTGGSPLTLKVIQNYEEMMNLLFEGWQRHFEFLYVAYKAYEEFYEACQDIFPGISDEAIGKMIAGFDSDLYRPDEELSELAELAIELGEDVTEILKSDAAPESKLKQLETTTAGRTFKQAFDQTKDPWFYFSYGDGIHSADGSWIDDLKAPFDHLASKIERLEDGESIRRNVETLQAERHRIVDEYRKYIENEESRERFDEAYADCMSVYRYTEDHVFWIEHRLHTIVFTKMRKFGRLAVNEGLLEEPDDIFMFTRYEISELLREVCSTWALGPTGYVTERWKDTARDRHKLMEVAEEWSPPPAIGNAPNELTDPLLEMLWGINDEKIDDWLADESTEEESTDGPIEGFSSSPGIAEGRARVVTDAREIGEIKDDEILVAPYTNSSWAPVFPRIGGVVTNDGGITSHAAIVCREYGVPAVTGTDDATTRISTGDRIKVNGGNGTIEILTSHN